VEINFPGRRVRFLDPKSYEVPEHAEAVDEAVLPLHLVANRPVVELSVEGKPLPVLLNTSDPVTAVLSGRSLHKASLEWKAVLEFGGGGVLGPIDLELVEVASLSLGPFEFEPGFPLLVAPRGLYNQSTNTDSAIGYDLLAGFVVRIDYPRRRLWLRRVGDAPVTLFGADYAASRRSGALLRVDADGVRTVLVFPGSAAERIGLRSEDRVLHIEGSSSDVDPAGIGLAIGEGRGLTVRRQEDGTWDEIKLAGTGPGS
jgi:hypothetical protein